jgi:hypothetical protein
MASMFICCRCGEGFNTKNALSHHESRKHLIAINATSEGGNVVHCSFCFLYLEPWNLAAHKTSVYHTRQVQLLQAAQDMPVSRGTAHEANQTVAQRTLAGREGSACGGGGGGGEGGVRDVGTGNVGGGGTGGGSGGGSGGGGSGGSDGSESPDMHDGARGGIRDWMEDRSDATLEYDSHAFVGRVVLLPLSLKAAADAGELRTRAQNWQK